MRRPSISQNIRRAGDRSECGIMFVAGAFFTFFVIAMVGLALDAANLYRTQLRTQRVVDATATRGAFLMKSTGNNAAVEFAARELARNNLAQMGMYDPSSPPAQDPINISFQTVNSRQILVDVDTDVPLMLLSATPWIEDATKNLRARAVGETASVAVSIVIDTTGSMNCPAAASCAEDPNNPLDPKPLYCANNWSELECSSRGPRRIEALRDAVKNFVTLFDPNVDQLAITTFSTSAFVRHQMGTFSVGVLQHQIGNYNATGTTNIQAGIEMGATQLASVTNPALQKILVLFTDGAPNVSDQNDPVCGGISDEQAHYIRAIQAAEAARAQHAASFYTVGLGVRIVIRRTRRMLTRTRMQTISAA